METGNSFNGELLQPARMAASNTVLGTSGILGNIEFTDHLLPGRNAQKRNAKANYAYLSLWFRLDNICVQISYMVH